MNQEELPVIFGASFSKKKRIHSIQPVRHTEGMKVHIMSIQFLIAVVRCFVNILCIVWNSKPEIASTMKPNHARITHQAFSAFIW